MEKADLLIVSAPADGEFKADLKRHLYPLEWERRIALLEDLDLAAVHEPDPSVRERLGKADIVVLLISADALASGFVQGADFTPTFERYERHQCAVVAVILRPCDWKSAPLIKLEVQPERGRPVVEWPDREEAFGGVAARVRREVEKIETRRQADARRAQAFGSPEY